MLPGNEWLHSLRLVPIQHRSEPYACSLLFLDDPFWVPISRFMIVVVRRFCRKYTISTPVIITMDLFSLHCIPEPQAALVLEAPSRIAMAWLERPIPAGMVKRSRF